MIYLEKEEESLLEVEVVGDFTGKLKLMYR